MKSIIPKSHPRHESLRIRNLLVKGIELGITSPHGLLAHGRGEAFDYLLGEKTHPFAVTAILVASARLVLAQRPVVSVNGNTAALVPNELIQLGKLVNAPLEVNLFHPSKEREQKIKQWLLRHGKVEVLLPQNTRIPKLESHRQYVNSEGMYDADVVFVPLEDGDRTETLVAMGKKVITVDLNPLSRTARKATISIVDNIVRAMPLLIAEIEKANKEKREHLEIIIAGYDNDEILQQAEEMIRSISS